MTGTQSTVGLDVHLGLGYLLKLTDDNAAKRFSRVDNGMLLDYINDENIAAVALLNPTPAQDICILYRTDKDRPLVGINPQ